MVFQATLPLEDYVYTDMFLAGLNTLNATTISFMVYLSFYCFDVDVHWHAPPREN